MGDRLDFRGPEAVEGVWRQCRETEDLWAFGCTNGTVLTIGALDDVAHRVSYGLRGCYGRLISDDDPWEMSLYGDAYDLTDTEARREAFSGETWLVRPTEEELDRMFVQYMHASRHYGEYADGIYLPTPEGTLRAYPIVDGPYTGIAVDLVDPEDVSSVDRLSLTEVIGPEVRDRYPTGAHTFAYTDTTDEAVRVDARTPGDVRAGVPMPDQGSVGLWLSEDVAGNLAAESRGLRVR